MTKAKGEVEHEFHLPSIEECMGNLAEAERAIGLRYTDNPKKYMAIYGSDDHLKLVEARDHWRSLLRMAEERARYGWRSMDGTLIPATPGKWNGRTRTRNSAEFFIGQCKRFLGEMKLHDYGSPMWRAARNRAKQELVKAQIRATEPMDWPEVPEPPAPRLRPSDTLNKLVALLAKYEAEGDKRNASWTRAKVRRYCRETGAELPEHLKETKWMKL